MITDKNETVAILGISPKPTRYSYLAYQRLLENQFSNIIGITPKNISLPEITIVKSLPEIKTDIHTLTVYIGIEKLTSLIEDIINLKPKRIILNPGTENPELIEKAQKANIEVIEGCTLVMLGTNQF